jgi:murein L,D-transpeptidase YcbB/YkuD
MIDTGETRTVTLKQPVTILLLYWTTGFDDSGAVIFKQDIYNRDALVLAGLNRPFSFRERALIGRVE